MTIETSIATAVTSAVADVATGISTVSGWWFVPIVVSIFVASVVIGLVGSFFGKRRRKNLPSQ